jgi:putative spermidine/putrescine transport system permease protein
MYLGRFSFYAWAPLTGMVPDWTLASYIKFLSHSYYLGTLFRTIWLALVVTVTALIMGYPIAYLMSISPRYRNLLLLLVVAPIMTDTIVRAYGWIVLLDGAGIVNTTIMALGLADAPVKIIYSEWSVVCEMLHETLAFMVLPIAAVMQKLDPNLAEAANTLGAGRWRTFWSITFRLSLPGVLAGTLLVFALNMSAFVGPLVLGGGNVDVMSVLISDQMGVTLDWPLGSAMSIVLVAITLTLLFLYRRALQMGTERVRNADEALS